MFIILVLNVYVYSLVKWLICVLEKAEKCQIYFKLRCCFKRMFFLQNSVLIRNISFLMSWNSLYMRKINMCKILLALCKFVLSWAFVYCQVIEEGGKGVIFKVCKILLYFPRLSKPIG